MDEPEEKKTRNPLKNRRKKKLLEIQQLIYNLEGLMNKLEDLETERDEEFIKVIKKLSKLTKTDYENELEKDRDKFYRSGNIRWKARDSLRWLKYKLYLEFKKI